VVLDVERAAESLSRCPIGCAFLAPVDANLTVDEAVTPRTSFAIAAQALDSLGPWVSNHDRLVERSLKLGAGLGDLARDLLSHPDSSWWSAPFEGTQVWIGYGALPGGSIEGATQSATDRTRGETYAQRPTGWQITSRLFNGASCLDFVARLAGDWRVPSLSRAVVEPIEEARVLEIGSAADWHRLCTQYPSPILTSQGDPSGEGVLAPYWSAVARDWDGVHLTFLGLLTAPFVRTESAAGASMLWSWDTEGTVWLRPELLQPVEDPIPLAAAEDPTYRGHGGRRFSDPLFSLADFDPNDPSMVLLQPGQTALLERRWRMWWRRLQRWAGR